MTIVLCIRCGERVDDGGQRCDRCAKTLALFTIESQLASIGDKSERLLEQCEQLRAELGFHDDGAAEAS